MSSFQAAVIQLNSTSDHEGNLQTAAELICEAAAGGATFISTPENTNFLGPHEEKVRRAESMDGPTCSLFSALAWELSVTLLLGSFNEVGPDDRRCYNTSVLFGPDGEILATYRKIHLFDVDIAAAEGASEVRFIESQTVAAGDRVVVQDLPGHDDGGGGRLGMSICYDLRFGELYRRLVEEGAELISVPSAFTERTGRDHWRPLLTARAIETQCWVLAAAQTGRHDDRGLRESHGQSMILDPWGRVVAEVEEGVGWAVAEIDLEQVHRVRRSMPVAEHRRL